jgi:hypothetical protein
MKRNGPWGKDEIQDLLRRSDTAVVRGLMVLYALQTDDEQATETTREDNKVGFTGYDAEFLTSVAKQYERKGYLSPKQIQAVRRKLMKYWRQLADRANQTTVQPNKVVQPRPDTKQPVERPTTGRFGFNDDLAAHWEIATAKRERARMDAEYAAGVADARRYQHDKAMYGQQLADKWAQEEEIARYNRGED